MNDMTDGNKQPILRVPVAVSENDTSKFIAYFVEAFEKVLSESLDIPYTPSLLLGELKEKAGITY